MYSLKHLLFTRYRGGGKEYEVKPVINHEQLVSFIKSDSALTAKCHPHIISDLARVLGDLVCSITHGHRLRSQHTVMETTTSARGARDVGVMGEREVSVMAARVFLLTAEEGKWQFPVRTTRCSGYLSLVSLAVVSSPRT